MNCRDVEPSMFGLAGLDYDTVSTSGHDGIRLINAAIGCNPVPQVVPRIRVPQASLRAQLARQSSASCSTKE